MSKDQRLPTTDCDQSEQTLITNSKKPKNIVQNDSGRRSKMEEDHATKPISFFALFRFSTGFEVFILFLGILGAIGHGATEPLMVYFLANLIETFIGQSTNDCDKESSHSSRQTATLVTRSLALNDSERFNRTNFSTTTTMPSVAIFRQQLHQQALLLIATGCATIVLAFLQTACFSLACERQTRRIREKAFRILIHQKISYYDTHNTGELATILNSNINQIHDGIGDKLGLAIQFVAKFGIGLSIAFFHSWKITLVVLSLAPILWLVLIVSAEISAKMSARELQAYAKAGAIAEEVFSNVRTVFSFNGTAHEQKRYDKQIELARKQGVKKGIAAGILSGSTYAVLLCSYALSFWYGHRLIQTEKYSIADVFRAFLSVMVGVFSLEQSAPYRQSVNQAKVAAAPVWHILAMSERQSTNHRKTSNRCSVGMVKFENVHFAYPSRPEQFVLRGLTFEAAPGQTVALVGTSGCGKSTSIQLLQRFYEPNKGQILLDGQPIDGYSSDIWHANIGVVNQDPILFATTIRKNIEYGRPGATLSEIEEAAMAANAHHFIMALPEKYDTIVGDRGAQLSGGERQRIVIARALIRNPKLLLLDEASSALDNQSERIVQRALEQAARNRTTIVVTHRLSTVQHAHKILVMDKGMVVEEGNHETLMKLQSFYYNLVKAQVFEEPIECTEQRPWNRTAVPDDNDQSNSDIETRSLQQEDPTLTVRSKKTLRWPSLAILKLNRPELLYIIIGALASCFNGGLEPITSVIIGEIIGIYQDCDIKVQTYNIHRYVIMFLLLALITFVTMFIQDLMFACSGEALTKRLRSMAFRTILQQEIGWFDQPDSSTGNLCIRLSTDAAMIQGVAGIRIGKILSSVANLGIGIIIGFIFGWRLSLIAMIFIPTLLVGGFLQSYLTRGFFSQDSRSFEHAGALAVQALQNIRTVRQLMAEEQFMADYTSLLDIPYRSSIRRTHLLASIYSVTTSTIFFSMAAVFFYGGLLVERNEMTFKDVLIVFNCMIIGAQIVGQTSAMAPDYGKAVSAAEKMLNLFARESKTPSNSVGLRLENFNGDLHFKGVTFTYPTRSHLPILNQFNLDIKIGQKVALVGPSGNGKSTVLHLLERFYDVNDGSVLIGSKNIQQINLHWWRSQVGMVTQEPALFNVSIAENLAYGDLSRNVSMQEMIEAAKQANIHDFIQSLPEGYQTCVGLKGSQLSGGQKQRIAIARVLIRNPKLILLDEATSALDNESEKVVTEALARAMIGRTSVVVAHRLSTILDADLICVLHQGQIIESGTHHQLLHRKGFYYNLVHTMAEK